jgi:hypothetical protein
MIVDKIIVGNVTVEQRLLFEVRKHDVGLYYVPIPFVFFVLLPSKVIFFKRTRLGGRVNVIRLNCTVTGVTRFGG